MEESAALVMRLAALVFLSPIAIWKLQNEFLRALDAARVTGPAAACRAQNDRPLVSRLTNIGMAAGLLRLPESDCFGPQSQASRYGDRKSRGGDPLLGRPGARAPISGISDPRFVRLAEFRLLGLSVPVIASSKL
jgi:hypothetical protein